MAAAGVLAVVAAAGGPAQLDGVVAVAGGPAQLDGVVAAAGGREIDRVVAVVAGHVLLASDVRAFRQLGLIEDDPVQAPAEPASVVRWLIRRRLALDEVDRFRVPPPPPERVERDVAGIRDRLGPERFEAVRASVGYEPPDLRQIVSDNARLDAYVIERFGTAERLGETALREYYDDHRDRFTVPGRDASFEAVAEAVRAVLWSERRAALVDDWMEGLVGRAAITRFED